VLSPERAYSPPQPICAAAVSVPGDGESEPANVVTVAKRPDFRRECGREDSNLQGAFAPTGPKPAASASSATPAVSRRIEASKRYPEMREQDERERQSRESSETRFEEKVRRESEERAEAAKRLPDPPPPEEENEGD
jgi:hypothetical protein